MRRTEKYPDTATFHFYNANPKNRVTTGDCVYRAVSTALDIPWEQAVMELAQSAVETGYSPASRENVDRYLKKFGWKKCKQPKREDGTKYTADEFCSSMQFILGRYRELKDSRIVASVGGHHIAAIVNAQVYDTWNSTDGCIGNYWIKG